MAKFTQVSWSQPLKPATSFLLLRGVHKPNSSDNHWRPDACERDQNHKETFYHLTIATCTTFPEPTEPSRLAKWLIKPPESGIDKNNKVIITARLTSRRDVFNSLPRQPDVFITVTPASGKVLCNYFIEVPTRHHPRKLPYWCRGCKGPEITSAGIQICIDFLYFLFISSQIIKKLTESMSLYCWIKLLRLPLLLHGELRINRKNAREAPQIEPCFDQHIIVIYVGQILEWRLKFWIHKNCKNHFMPTEINFEM